MDERARIKQDTLMFFGGHIELLPVYEAFETELFRLFPGTKVKVQKTQIAFSNRHIFACVSFLRPGKKSLLPESYFVLTLGLPYPLSSPRAAAKTEPYPGRWTTHIPVSSEGELDGELFGWIKEAYDFAENK